MSDIESVHREVGQNIRLARKDARITQEELAEHLDVSKTTITNMEMGRQRISLTLIEKCAIVFNIPPVTLLPKSWSSLTDLEDK